MADSTSTTPFRSAVSEVKHSWVGQGTSRSKHEHRVYYLVEGASGENVELRRLGPTWVPLEEWLRTLTPDEFALMRPEPLIYFNKVQPAMQTLSSTLDKGDKMREIGHHDRAVEFYREAVRLSPNNIRACFGLGISYLHSENEDNALLVLDQLLELKNAFSPNYKHLFNEFGIALRKKGLHEEALKYYLKARKLCGDDENLLLNIGRLLFEMGDRAHAATILEKAISLGPGFVEVRKLLSHIRRLSSN